MQPQLVFWTLALVDLCAVVGFAVSGVRALRRGDVPGHRRRMLTSASLVGLFLAAYLVKLAALGREDFSLWSAQAIWVLRLHELCVFSMLVAGAVAGSRALRLRTTRRVTGRPEDPPAPARLLRAHRRAGWIAVVAASLAFGFAALVLGGMYRRAGLF
jgi:hypothetical protein